MFYPSYQLSAVRISTESGAVTVEVLAIVKPGTGTEDLTLTDRLLTLGRKPDPTILPPVETE